MADSKSCRFRADDDDDVRGDRGGPKRDSSGMGLRCSWSFRSRSLSLQDRASSSRFLSDERESGRSSPRLASVSGKTLWTNLSHPSPIRRVICSHDPGERAFEPNAREAAIKARAVTIWLMRGADLEVVGVREKKLGEEEGESQMVALRVEIRGVVR